MSMNRIVRNVVLCCSVLALPGGNAISLKYIGEAIDEANSDKDQCDKGSIKDESLVPGNKLTQLTEEWEYISKLPLEQQKAYKEYMKRVQYLQGTADADNKWVKKLAPYINEKGWAALRNAPTYGKQFGEKTGNYLFVKEISDFKKGKVVVVLNGEINDWIYTEVNGGRRYESQRRAYFTTADFANNMSEALSFRKEEAEFGHRSGTVHQTGSTSTLREFEFSMEDLLSLIAPKNAHEEKYGDIARYVKEDFLTKIVGNIWAEQKFSFEPMTRLGQVYCGYGAGINRWMMFQGFDKLSRTIAFVHHKNLSTPYGFKDMKGNDEFMERLECREIHTTHISIDPSTWEQKTVVIHHDWETTYNEGPAYKTLEPTRTEGFVKRFQLKRIQ